MINNFILTVLNVLVRRLSFKTQRKIEFLGPFHGLKISLKKPCLKCCYNVSHNAQKDEHNILQMHVYKQMAGVICSSIHQEQIILPQSNFDNGNSRTANIAVSAVFLIIFSWLSIQLCASKSRPGRN